MHQNSAKLGRFSNKSKIHRYLFSPVENFLPGAISSLLLRLPRLDEGVLMLPSLLFRVSLMLLVLGIVGTGGADVIDDAVVEEDEFTEFEPGSFKGLLVLDSELQKDLRNQSLVSFMSLVTHSVRVLKNPNDTKIAPSIFRR